MRPLHSALVTPACTGINFYLPVGFTAASAPVPAHARSQRVTTAAGSKGATLAGASTGGDKVAPTGSPLGEGLNADDFVSFADDLGIL